MCTRYSLERPEVAITRMATALAADVPRFGPYAPRTRHANTRLADETDESLLGRRDAIARLRRDREREAVVEGRRHRRAADEPRRDRDRGGDAAEREERSGEERDDPDAREPPEAAEPHVGREPADAEHGVVALRQASDEVMRAHCAPIGPRPAPPRPQPQPPAILTVQPPTDEMIEALDEPSWEDVMGLFRNEKIRGFVVDVETDSTIEPE
mgnify:CR=1 FL=1